MLREYNFLLYFDSRLFQLFPPSTVLQRSLLLLIAHQLQRLGISSLLLLIPLHKVENVDRIHVQIGQICRCFHLFLHLMVQSISFGLALI